MSTEHTPGPWELLTGTVSSASGDEIAEVVGGDGGRYLDDDVNAQCLANARLIAAAPELLEACRLILMCDEYSPDPAVSKAMVAARAAIAKATAE